MIDCSRCCYEIGEGIHDFCQCSCHIQKIKLPIKYYTKIWYDPLIDEEGVLVRTQFWKFHYDDFPRLENDIPTGDKVFPELHRTTIEVPSFSHGQVIPKFRCEGWQKYVRFLKQFLLDHCEQQLKRYMIEQCEKHDLKNVRFEFDFEEVEPPLY